MHCSKKAFWAKAGCLENRLKSSGRVVRQHAAFAPARQKRLGSRLRSPLLAERSHARSASHTASSPLCLRMVMQSLRVFEAPSLSPVDL
jgi:hypothetical protein